MNKKTPHTIGVMSWVKAKRRRNYLETGMKEKPKENHLFVKGNKPNFFKCGFFIFLHNPFCSNFVRG